MDPVKEIDRHRHAFRSRQTELEHAQALLIYSADIIARFGGDEFAVIAEDIKSMDDVQEIAKKIAEAITPDIHYETDTINVGTSVGISFYPQDSLDIDELLSMADKAMYEAKKQKSKNNRGVNICRWDSMH